MSFMYWREGERVEAREETAHSLFNKAGPVDGWVGADGDGHERGVCGIEGEGVVDDDGSPRAVDKVGGAAEIAVDAEGAGGKGRVEGGGMLEADDEGRAERAVCHEMLGDGVGGQTGRGRRVEGHWAPDGGEGAMKLGEGRLGGIHE